MSWLTLAGLLSSIGAAKMQMQASQEAARRADLAIQKSLENQRRLQMEAQDRALSATQQFAPEGRLANQQNIEDTLNQELLAPIEKNPALSFAPGTTGNVSQDYDRLKAQSDLNTLKSSRELAKIMSKISSANRLRMNEGVNLMDAGRDIDMLNNFSKGQIGADEIAINKASQLNPSKIFGSQVLGALGTAGIARGGSFGSPGEPAMVYDRSTALASPRSYQFGLNPNKKSTFSLS